MRSTSRPQRGFPDYGYEVESPCINVCMIEEYYCIGCGRSQDEIMEWFYADNDRKLEILDEISERVKNGEIELYMS